MLAATDTTQLVFLAVLAIFTAITAPTILNYMTNRNRAVFQQKQWDREDAVAAKAETVARQAAEAAQLLVESNKRMADVAVATRDTVVKKLDVIHTLVNSNMTAAMQDSLDSNIRERAMMLEVIALHRAAGSEPTPEALTAVAAIDEKIVELQKQMEDRKRQAEVVAEQTKTDPGAAVTTTTVTTTTPAP